MSRYCGVANSEPVLAAADDWRDKCFIGGKSIFNNKGVWTSNNTDQLMRFFVNNLNTGEGNFLAKLEGQLESAAPEAKQLAAEMMWVMLLCPSNIKPPKKRQNINAIMEWAGEVIESENRYLTDSVLGGIGSGGTAYNNLRWMELEYFIRLTQDFLLLDKNQKNELMSDGRKFSKWCEAINGNEQRQFRHMILFLLFPDSFERVFGANDRKEIAISFSVKNKREIKKLSAYELDLLLAELRAVQEKSYGTKN